MPVMRRLTAALLAGLALSTTPLAAQQQAATGDAQSAHAPRQWTTLISATDLHERLGDKNLLVIDARSPEQYAAGHIPGAINLPGSEWRTPAAAPGEVGQRIFRQADGSLDVKRYEEFLSKAGVRPDHQIVVYGNHAGKADGSIPAAILLKLGHENVAFLDGVGLDEWRTFEYHVSTTPTILPPSRYVAHADAQRLWSYEQVLDNLDNPDVVIVDSRTPAEFAGDDLRGNQRGGHIPGAVLLNAADFLDPTSHKTIDLVEAKRRIEAEIPKEKTVVIYCQSGTRCSHKELMLKDLGYKNVVLYDSSWQEWGNRPDAPIEKSAPSERQP